MAQLFEFLFRGLLEWLGIDLKQQFLLMVIVLIAWFVVYMIRSRENDRVLSVTFVLMAIAFLVFLFTELPRARWSAAAIVAP